ncbi:MAG: peptidylprolyl isomerase [Bacteroidetes bacterium]|jgi:peptidylprolyl isomerase|nr:peptidylprolyl isomerase [Bacteroidota bacterium]MBT6684708.1 peptidylprolyl isomerase [Bacteroidota bacterium]MBT7143167.1 peptidylprolyl isomerase [Bacteroidota bacterium]MBT7492610.1 peptidylprolyl isomerase [Bacteroidota bacterium]
MKHSQIIFIIIISIFSLSAISQNAISQTIKIETNFGDITLKLYDETPLHKDNFLKLISQNFYDSLLFHRVMDQFMIQGGDPDSKSAISGNRLGNGGPGYTIPAEFVENIIHKKGVLAAAREGDQINPEKRSSGSQFYIVEGKLFTNEEIDKFEEQRNNSKKTQITLDFIARPENIKIKNKVDSLQKMKDIESLRAYALELEKFLEDDFAKMEKFKYSEEQRKLYTTIGGTPHLDGAYTVFGEVIEGFDTIEKISQQKCDEYSRPFVDVRMKISISE